MLLSRHKKGIKEGTHLKQPLICAGNLLFINTFEISQVVEFSYTLFQVDFANEEGIRRLEDAIGFAKPIQDVDTNNVEPMYSVLDEETIR